MIIFPNAAGVFGSSFQNKQRFAVQSWFQAQRDQSAQKSDGQ